jgi:hypothetical protein
MSGALQPLPVASALHEILETDRLPFPARLEAIHGLPQDLGGPEVEAISAFLRSPPPDSGGVVEKNDLLNVLRAQATPPTGFTRLLADICRDPRQDDVLRDYALQHAVLWYAKSENQDLVIEMLRDALTETQTSMAGTALTGLHTLFERHQAVEASLVRQAALDILANPAAGELARITSLRIAGALRLEDALPAAREVLQGTASVPLRIAALATVGDLGSRADLATLSEIESKQDQRLEAAVHRAIAQLTGI